MKNENIPADIKSKSLKEAKEEIDVILGKLERQEADLSNSLNDYQRLIQLNKHIDLFSCFNKHNLLSYFVCSQQRVACYSVVIFVSNPKKRIIFKYF